LGKKGIVFLQAILYNYIMEKVNKKGEGVKMEYAKRKLVVGVKRDMGTGRVVVAVLECGHEVKQQALVIPKSKYCEECYVEYAMTLPRGSEERLKVELRKFLDAGLSKAQMLEVLKKLNKEGG